MWKIFHRIANKVHNGANKVSSDNSDVKQVWPESEPGYLPNLTDFAKQQLESYKLVKKPSKIPNDVKLDKFVELSEQFPVQFATDTCRVKSQPVKRLKNISQQIVSAYPIIHERVLFLYLNFLEHKINYGNPVELRVYQNLTVPELVQRILSKRCAYFLNSYDAYMLIGGRSGYAGFEQIGSVEEQSPLLLKDVLSYDEIKLSALLSVTTHSEFINNGSRDNCGVVEADPSKIESEGVVMGLVGGRFHRKNVMEYQDIMITHEQNISANGYGGNSSCTRSLDYRRIWNEFYGEPKDFCFEEVKKSGKRFLTLDDGKIFDKVVMGKRYAISFDTLLLEAESRAVEAGKPAYLHVTGFGLGVWKVTNEQTYIFLEIFEQRLRALSDRLTHVGVVHFSWFGLDKWCGLSDGARIPVAKHPQGGIEVRFSNRNPADKIIEHLDMLPFVTYAWDANALPGNEFWGGALTGSADPAAASSTLITELQNAHINKDFMCGNNLHIASLQHGVLHISDYAKQLLA